MGFQQSCQHRRGDVVGQVGADHRGQAVEHFRHQLRQILLQNVSVPDGHVVILRHGLLQDGQQSGVQFDGHHTTGTLCQLLGQGANAGANLQDTAMRICTGGFGDIIGDIRINEEILPHGLGKTKAMTA